MGEPILDPGSVFPDLQGIATSFDDMAYDK